ncbi:MAG: Hemophore HasA [Paracidovorax wautersii]|uniref:Hemophore HasA n=1 Tax=Paracidovorax wautersii TaxID=1177982 RepID=A0A7V8FNH9_9BURK|nr:MAG: Hemophore HasA [Paracidovorax wautersii]
MIVRDATVNYGATFNNYANASPQGWVSLATFFPAFDAHFQVADHEANPGEFVGTENPDPVVDPDPTGVWGLLGYQFSGSQYVLEGETSSLNLGFIVQAAEGSYLSYTFFSGQTHTLYGEISSITFGSGLAQDSNGDYYFTEELLSISGLDTIGLNGGLDENGDVIDRTTGENDTHNIVNGLMNGDSSALVAVLDVNGYPSVATSLELVGVASNDADVLLAA